MNKKEVIGYFDALAPKRDNWRRRNSYYHREIVRLIKFFVPENSSVLDIGSSTGELLHRLRPGRGVGIDLSPAMVSQAAKKYPHLKFLVQDAEELGFDEKFDYVVLAGSIYLFEDIWKVFRSLRRVTDEESRLVVTYYNWLWEPALKLAEKVGLRMPRHYQNWIGLKDISNLLYLNGYEIIRKGKKVLFPLDIPVLSWFFNKILANLPLVSCLCLAEYIVARKTPLDEAKGSSCSVVVPCRNEAGNIEPLLNNLPLMGSRTEVIFVDGYSTDGTVEKIKEMAGKFKGRMDIRLIDQIPREDQAQIRGNLVKKDKMLKLGKGDAVRKGFDAASGDLLMILDADCTVAPEELPKFYHALAESRGEFINGSRLVYPLEKESMRLFNLYANEAFGYIFSWLLGQRLKDTLCGTKALSRESYLKIKRHREYFGNFDPFGDFDLLFGAAMQNLRIAELPIRYRARKYGDIKIERFKHGLLLLKMCFFGFLKFKLQ